SGGGVVMSGLSPRMRGTGARARRSWPLSTVYPRGCGERCEILRDQYGLTGLSPRMRGTAPGSGVLPGRSRFIPADAGNGGGQAMPSLGGPVYPRGCGERGQTLLHENRIDGLSPRMRGTVAARQCPAWAARFIPADAGNGDKPYSTKTGLTVYPRGCGERSDSA